MEENGEKLLEDIKRLLMLLLIKLDTNSEELGHALQVHPDTARKMMPSSKIKKITSSS